MTSPPLDSTDNRQRRAWHDITAIRQHTVGRRRTWHNINALGQHTRSNDVGRGMPASPLDSTWSKDVGRGMTSPPLDSAHGRTTSSATCHHRHKKAHTVKRRRAWHAIITFGQHTRSNDVGRGMTSPPLDSTLGRTTSGVTCQNRLWAAYTVERRLA